MSTVALEPLFYLRCRETPIHRSKPNPFTPLFLTTSSNLKLNLKFNASFTFHQPHMPLSPAASITDTPIVDSLHCSDTFFSNTLTINRTQMVEGKVFVRLDQAKDSRDWDLTVGCNLPGKWILHWGVTLVDDDGREWDQPPGDMIPPGSVPIKDYAIETPLKKSYLPAEGEGDTFHEVRIDLKPNNDISAISFVLKDEETGAWYRNKGRDFKVPLINYLKEDTNTVGPKRGFSLWPGSLRHISKMLFKSRAGQDDRSESRDPKQENNQLEGFYVEMPITKEVPINNFINVSIKKYFESEAVKNLLYLETDLPGDVVLHWGVCRDDSRRWEVPPAPHPPQTVAFKDKALRTHLTPRGNGQGSSVQITLGEEFSGFLCVLKQNGNTWFKYKGNDFYIPLSSSSSLLISGIREYRSEGVQRKVTEEASQETPFFAFSDETINETRSMVTENSSEKSVKTKSKEAQKNILQEIQRLATEAYNFFKSSIPTFSEATIAEPEATVGEREATFVEPEATITEPEATEESKKLTLDLKICSGTGTGYEIICQGFNWESHKSGRWYMELKEKVSELASIGFTVVWLPPPTESVSPEGYMPKDLYNLNSRYGNIYELREMVKRFHEVGIKVLGDAVLNHRCAHYQNQNGIWNLFGGRLNWDNRAVVADDPHFQGRGNKSSGDNFHAAPNIDHSQEFVRKDLKEWLCWLRKEVGYDGWRLDFVRGFWGGYVKDYVDASEPYFAVGEYWDSLSYSYGEMDYNQDAHRQRIIDWIGATYGTASAFDVTTKGILHSALERCEYWRLSDQEGKPPGVVGWWPSRAVTFIENHDTGSTQGHWRFPSGKEMQGYAYILTHPGTPSVFFDHIFSHYKTEIATLLSIRKRNKIHCRSTVQVSKAERDVYAAIIDEKIAMKIGPGHFEPRSGPPKWSLAIDRSDYKIWEAS